MAEDSPTVHVQYGRVHVFTGSFVVSPPATVDREGTEQHVRCPRFPQSSLLSWDPEQSKSLAGLFPWLHLEWSTSRVSLGDSTKARHRARQNQQRSCILVLVITLSMVHWWCNFGAKSQA